MRSVRETPARARPQRIISCRSRAGERSCAVMLTPAALWALIALVPVSLGAGVAGALDLALGDRAPDPGRVADG